MPVLSPLYPVDLYCFLSCSRKNGLFAHVVMVFHEALVLVSTNSRFWQGSPLHFHFLHPQFFATHLTPPSSYHNSWINSWIYPGMSCIHSQHIQHVFDQFQYYSFLLTVHVLQIQPGCFQFMFFHPFKYTKWQCWLCTNHNMTSHTLSEIEEYVSLLVGAGDD